MKRLTTEEFIKKAIKIHGNKYDYSKVNYINSQSKVIIICPIHGEFLQIPANHLSGYGCLICSGKCKSTLEEFIQKANVIHGYKYDYSKFVYINNGIPGIIICPIHGDFLQRSGDHLHKKYGCPKCSPEAKKFKKIYTTEWFIKKSKEIHGDKYDYSKVVYINNSTNVIIICSIHGEFLQKPNNHLQGKNGCPYCKNSKGELLIEKTLDILNISYIKQKRFSDCINPKTKRNLPYDFYIPQENMLIEFNGEQHYKSLKHWYRNNNKLKDQQYRDSLKKQYALDHGFKFLIIKYNDNIEKVLKTNIHPF